MVFNAAFKYVFISVTGRFKSPMVSSIFMCMLYNSKIGIIIKVTIKI